MRRVWKGIAIAVAALLTLPSLVALAYSWYIDFTVTESAGTAYTSLPLGALVNNTYYAANGYISATGLNTRVYNSANTSLPHMLAEDKTWFVTAQPASNSQVIRYTMGETALSSFKIIPGYSGNITTSDNANLELGSLFDISVSGYFDTSAGSDKDIIFKDGAGKLDIPSASTIKWHALNADNSDNWTLTANPVASGVHTVRITSDGLDAYLYVDGAQADGESLIVKNLYTAIGSLTTFAYAPANRATFYAAGLYWVFFAHDAGAGKEINYITSPDGTTWSAKIEITSGASLVDGKYWSTWFDGTSFYYVYRDSALLAGFRKGTPESSGNFTWAAAEQSVTLTTAGKTMYWPTVAVGSDGHAQIAYQENDGAAQSYKTVRNSNTDGTWATTGGYPVTIWSAGAVNLACLTLIADYDSDDMYAFATKTSDSVLHGYYFNGSSWSGTADNWGTVGGTFPTGISAAFESDDDIVATWFNSTTQNLFNVRYSGGSMGTASTFGTYESGSAPTLTFDTVSGKTLLFWIDGTSDDLYFKTYTDGTWGSDTLVGTGTLDLYLSSQTYRFSGGNIGIADDFNSSIYFGLISWDWDWLDNGNEWAFMAGNSMSYSDNITISVSGVERLLYRPDSIISGTTLPDESGNGNDGTFNWGTNPASVTVVVGPVVSAAPNPTPTSPAAPWVLVPTLPADPGGLFTEGGECMPGLAEFADASEASGNPRAMFPIMLAFGLALLLGFAVYGATHVARMGQRGSLFLQILTSESVMVFFYVGGCSVIPGWVLIPFGVQSLFLLVGRNPQHSST